MINKNQVRSGKKAILKNLSAFYSYNHHTYIYFNFGEDKWVYIEHIQIENKSKIFVVQKISWWVLKLQTMACLVFYNPWTVLYRFCPFWMILDQIGSYVITFDNCWPFRTILDPFGTLLTTLDHAMPFLTILD